ncbi:hypothetical protein GCM10009678_54110 [Actinomadura kijaniata]|uniref:Uncharacterized protein n=1 Tax=Actinomadura namibiensis TaxID=182080 RepID=A0A7W3LRE8_ACTNM|nr:hypothetical protein [Actinomadura namibiensis]MBA8952951.1 hypothetical protein [Actinomadura namibiensis]
MGASMVGRVSQDRYLELVTKARELVEVQSRCQFALGAPRWRSNRSSSTEGKVTARSRRWSA